MHKPAKIFLVTIVAFIGLLSGLLLYFGYQPKVPDSVLNGTIAEQQVDQAMLEQDYRADTKKIVAEFSAAYIVDQPTDISRLNDAKSELLALTVPEEFKSLHLGLVMAADKLITAGESGNEQEKAAGLALIKEAKSRFDWLN